jgi:N-acetyl-gamma-glutamyl-phosphate reductase
LQKTIKAAILGASGYSGAELLRILSRHPNLEVGGLFAGASAGTSLEEALPWQKQFRGMKFEEFAPAKVNSTDVIFLALPSGEAMKLVPEIDPSKIIIDLGGDYRLHDSSDYEKFYGKQHTSHDLTRSAIYGLPEWNKEQITASKLIANPGCYPTSAILPLAPLLKEGVIDPSGIVINSMSGVSGAGRKASIDLSFAEVNETVKAYKVGDHQHIPEIKGVLKALTGADISFVFIPHLLPITRGIYTTTTAQLSVNVDAAKIANIYEEYYGDQPFIRTHSSAIPEIRNVVHTNYCDIGFKIVRDRIVLMSTIDNLLKGAAGQAVQNMNLMLGFAETEGLL